MKISRILSSKNWVAINLPLSKHLGLNAAFLFSHLCGLFEYYEARGELVEKDGEMYFYATIETIAENTPLGRPEQDTAIKILEQAGLLIKKTLGMPAKRYFSIPTSAETILYNILQFAGNRQTSLQETDKQVCANPTNKVVEKEQTSLQETDNNIDKELDLSNNNTFSKEKDISEKTEVFSTPTENKKIAANSNLDVGLFSKKGNQKEKEKNCGKKEKDETPETGGEDYLTAGQLPTYNQLQIKPELWAAFIGAVVKRLPAQKPKNKIKRSIFISWATKLKGIENKFADMVIINHFQDYQDKGWVSPFFAGYAETLQKAQKDYNFTSQNNNNQNATTQSTTKPNAQPDANTVARVLDRDRELNELGY